MDCANGCGRSAAQWANRNRQASYCGPACRREGQKRYQAEYKAKHKERLAAEDAVYYLENKERIGERVSEYRVAHAERLSEYHAAYYQARKTDPAYREQRAKRSHTRRARKRGARTESYTRKQVWERDEGVCGICNLPVDPADWHLDHIIPLGPGDDVLANVRVTHPKCNQSKAGEDRRVLADWKQAA